MATKASKRLNAELGIKEKEILGKPAKFIGILGESFTCPTCSRNLKTGIIYNHNNILYCSRNCIRVSE
jgi:hypothetical protein